MAYLYVFRLLPVPSVGSLWLLQNSHTKLETRYVFRGVMILELSDPTWLSILRSINFQSIVQSKHIFPALTSMPLLNYCIYIYQICSELTLFTNKSIEDLWKTITQTSPAPVCWVSSCKQEKCLTGSCSLPIVWCVSVSEGKRKRNTNMSSPNLPVNLLNKLKAHFHRCFI